MSQSSSQHREQIDSPKKIDAGDEIAHETRRAQKSGGNENCLTSNLTKTGAKVHGITHKTMLSVTIFENGIWITTADTED